MQVSQHKGTERRDRSLQRSQSDRCVPYRGTIAVVIQRLPRHGINFSFHPRYRQSIKSDDDDQQFHEHKEKSCYGEMAKQKGVLLKSGDIDEKEQSCELKEQACDPAKTDCDGKTYESEDDSDEECSFWIEP